MKKIADILNKMRIFALPISVNFDNSQGSIKARPENALFGLYQSCYVSSNEIHPKRGNFTCLYYKQSKAYTEDGKNVGSAFRICLLKSINRTLWAKSALLIGYGID